MEVYYLCPWEFCKWWIHGELHSPDWYQKRQRRLLTKWTPAGAPYVEALRTGTALEQLPPAKPGIHYKLREPVTEESHIAFPDITATH